MDRRCKGRKIMNEIAILIVGTGENSQQFKVGEPAYWNYEMRNEKRRVIAEIRMELRGTGLSDTTQGRIDHASWVFVGYDKKDTKDAKMLFEVPADKCTVIYKAALEVVSE